MSGRSSNGGSGGGGGAVVGSSSSSIPAGSRKMVQSLKEIVNNYPEAEIYAMLKECNMDPNEAVHRLLSQDPFREVKSKRDKKKEYKDITESRLSRGAGSNTSRGGRSGTDRYAGRGGSSQYGSSESGVLHSKHSYKKENGTNSASSAYGMAGNNANWHPPAPSDSTSTENKVSAQSEVDGILLVPQPPAAHQPAWVGIPGQKSMADIVKMGRPHVKSTSTLNSSQHAVNYQHGQVLSSNASHHDMRSEDQAPKVSEIISEPVASGQHIAANDEWHLVERAPAASESSVFESPAESKLHSYPSTLSFDRNNQFQRSQIDDPQEAEDGSIEHFSTDNGAHSFSSKTMQGENSGGPPFDNELYKNMDSFQTHDHSFQHHEVEGVGGPVSEVSANMQQLSIQKEDRGPPAEVDGPSVVIPNHLQVQGADCSHLSFGSFGSGISASFSGPFASRPLESNLQEVPTNTNALSVGHSDTRNPDYYGEESLQTSSDGDLVHRTSANAENNDSPSGSQLEALKQENSEVANDNQYSFPSSTPGYSFEITQQLNSGFPHSQASSQVQNFAPSSSVMAYTNSLPSNLLAATVQPGRESELLYLPFPMAQQLTTKYNNTVSSISSAAISISEALKTVSFSSAQPTAQALSGANFTTGPAPPQAIPMHPYSQPTLHFPTNLTYQYMPPNYTYVPSAFQQAYAGNSMYHQPMLPQYKNSVSVSTLPQSAAVASGYGPFGSSTNIPGNFQMNPPTAPAGTATNLDNILSSQYKDSSHLMPLQQNDNSAMWLHALGSRPVPAVPASTYYSFQGQNQQPDGFRQGQQSSQNYGGVGYNFYHSQTGISLEHQQQNLRDVSLGGSQGQPKQSQQIWQNSY